MRQTRREFIKQASVLAALSFPSLGKNTESAFQGLEKGQKRPNIIYLFSDEHRWHSMSCTEMPELKTPNMARLAKEGLSFVNCISNNPICMPYRTMLMTGKWPYATRALENNGGMLDPANQPTLAKTFKQAGYDTCYIGKWHIAIDTRDVGFHVHYGWDNTNNHWSSRWHEVHAASSRPTLCKQYNATGMTDQALAFLRGHAKAAKPIFMMVSWNPPHAKFDDAPADMTALYPKGSLSFRKNYMPPKEGKEQAAWLDYQGYHAHISAVDREIGRVLTAVEELGIADNTIIIYTADHGSMFSSHKKDSKRHPEEESIRVPFLARWPKKFKAGRTPQQLLGAIDIFPTLCALASISVPTTCQGSDLSRMFFDENVAGPASQFIMHISNKKEYDKVASDPKAKVFRPFFRGVRTPRYTYTVGVDGPWQLFDNVQDPYQLKNLIDDPSATHARAECQKMLDGWLAKAEYAYMAPDFKAKLMAMSLPDRIAYQNIEAVNYAKTHGSGADGEGE